MNWCLGLDTGLRDKVQVVQSFVGFGLKGLVSRFVATELSVLSLQCRKLEVWGFSTVCAFFSDVGSLQGFFPGGAICGQQPSDESRRVGHCRCIEQGRAAETPADFSFQVRGLCRVECLSKQWFAGVLSNMVAEKKSLASVSDCNKYIYIIIYI